MLEMMCRLTHFGRLMRKYSPLSAKIHSVFIYESIVVAKRYKTVSLFCKNELQLHVLWVKYYVTFMGA